MDNKEKDERYNKLINNLKKNKIIINYDELKKGLVLDTNNNIYVLIK